MEDIAFSVSVVFETEYYKRNKKKREGSRPHRRPGPAPRPACSAASPASLPATSGPQAGSVWRPPGLPAGLGRLPGRPTRVHAGLPGSPLARRPACRPGPAPRPVLAGGAPACLPAWAGSQAGLPSPVLAARKIAQRPYFWSPYLRGFFPKINANPFANLLSYFLPPLLTFSSLAFSQSLR